MTAAAALSSAHYLLEALAEAGVDHIFANLGTDHVTLIEEIARWDAEGRPHPAIIPCPHESVAVHMAGGYAMATGRGQAVLVHVDAGTANAAMALHNLARGRVPVLLMAGRSPFTVRGELPGSRDNYIHFVQDPFDIASLVRPYVKWDYSLSSGIVAKEAVRRACSVMHSDPRGPVYMTLPREILAASWEPSRIRAFDEARYGPIAAGGIAPERAREIAERLMAARHPVAVTAYLGRRPEAVLALEALAIEAGLRVFEFNPSHLSIARDSPCFGGFDPAQAIAEADLGLLLDVDVPFVPKFTPQAERLPWIQIDVDAGKRDMPMWGFAADLRIEGDCATILAQVLEIVRAEGGPEWRAAAAARVERWRDEASRTRAEDAESAADPGEFDAISVGHLCAEIGRRLAPRDILVNEAVRNAGVVLRQIPRTEPGTYFALAGGGLGFSGGTALGLKLAHPTRRVVQIVGDGVFHFMAPDSVLATAQQHDLPILTVVLDNRGWQAVKEAVLRVYPDGAAAAHDAFHARLERGNRQRRFDRVAEAFGGHGEYVADPAALGDAIDRCFAAIDAGRPALLHVRVPPLEAGGATTRTGAGTR